MDQGKSALPQQVLPITPGPALVSLPALPVTPQEAIPTTPQGMIDRLRATLSQKDEQLADTTKALLTVLEAKRYERAERTARAQRAGSTPKQISAVKDAERVEEWVATMKHQVQHGGRREKGYIDDLVANRRGEHAGTIKRARIKAGYK